MADRYLKPLPEAKPQLAKVRDDFSMGKPEAKSSLWDAPEPRMPVDAATQWKESGFTGDPGPVTLPNYEAFEDLTKDWDDALPHPAPAPQPVSTYKRAPDGTVWMRDMKGAIVKVN